LIGRWPKAQAALCLRKNCGSLAVSHAFQRLFEVVFDVEHFVESGDDEYFVDVGRIEQSRNLPSRLDFLVERDELAQRGAAEVFDVAEIQDDFLRPSTSTSAKSSLRLTGYALIQNFLIHKTRDSDRVDLFDVPVFAWS